MRKVPRHELPNTFLNRRCRRVADLRLQQADIGIGVRDITRLQRQQLLDGLLPKRLFQRFDIGRKLQRVVVAAESERVLCCKRSWVDLRCGVECFPVVSGIQVRAVHEHVREPHVQTNRWSTIGYQES